MWNDHGDCGSDVDGKRNPADPDSDNDGFSGGFESDRGIISMVTTSYLLNL
jgi:hypothetical protein